MISKSKQIEDLFKEIDGELHKKVEVYIIGGAALLLAGLKPSTKDIDLIIHNKEEFASFKNALSSLRFKSEKPTVHYCQMDLSEILVREDYRIDVFFKKVCKKFVLSDEMIKRSETILHLKNITINTCSNEDILLFKCMAERDGDVDDCIELAKTGLDWETIKKELINQININGQDVWITYVGERFDILMKRGLTIPIMKDINTLRHEFFLAWEKNINNKKNKNEIG